MSPLTRPAAMVGDETMLSAADMAETSGSRLSTAVDSANETSNVGDWLPAGASVHIRSTPGMPSTLRTSSNPTPLRTIRNELVLEEPDATTK